jgi:putative peptidoglycan lipid II flippase
MSPRRWQDDRSIDPRLQARRPPRPADYSEPDPSPLSRPQGDDPSPHPRPAPRDPTTPPGSRTHIVIGDSVPAVRQPVARQPVRRVDPARRPRPAPPARAAAPGLALRAAAPAPPLRPAIDPDPPEITAGDAATIGRRSGNVPRSFAAIAGLSAIGTALSRVTGLVRTVVQGSVLGINGVSDAYTLANTTPNIIYDLILGGVLSGTLVPVFVEALRDEDDPSGGWEAISAVCTAIAVVLVAVTVVFFLATPLIIRLYTLGNHTAAKVPERQLAVSLLYLFVPQVALYGIAAVISAILQARGRYAPVNFTPILNNLLVIGVLVAAGVVITVDTPAAVHHQHGAVLLLGLGTTAGVAAMTLALVPYLRAVGARLRPVWNFRHPAIRTILHLSKWTFGFVVANQVCLLIVIVLSGHHPGDYTAYFFAYSFMILPHGVWTVSVMQPMETEVARDWQAGNRDGARRKMVESIWLVLVIVMPAALGMAALARPAIAIALEHGNVSPAGARATADALIAMALGLPGYSLYLLFMRAYQAMQDTRTMFLIYLVENGLNIVFDLALYHRFGVRGLAAGLGLAYTVAAVLAFVHLSGRMGGLGGRTLRAAAVTVTAGAVVAALAAWGASSLLAHFPGGHRQLGIAARVTAGVVAGVTVYLLAASALAFGGIRTRLQLRRRPT